ncbi:MAG: hypothetical protein JO301_06080 [Chitinophagaceae bacterium]|nr:hypothetical protein [Chitinophagaceae bacterium]
MRKLVACLACRNNGSRLYGKPVQNLDIAGQLTVLDYIITALKSFPDIDAIVLGISEGNDNLGFVDIAAKHSIDYIIGDANDVLQRLIRCCEKAGGTDIFRVTTESPFTYFEAIKGAWESHVSGNYDITALDNLPDGSGFEITTLDAYKRSWDRGESKHRSELCSLYIREHKDEFRMQYIDVPREIRRTDIRLTIDYPEDLILCRAVYQHFKKQAPLIPLQEIIRFLDAHPELKALVDPFVEEGLKTMYI